ncbi:MAG: ATP-binding protein, partial [Vicinamibacteria bacterium]
IGHAELLTLKAEADPELKRHAQLILSASERAAQLTRELLSFSRKREPFVETVGVNQLVRNVLAILERSLDPRIRVVTELEAEPDWVDADAAALESALLNLAVNGRDAMPTGGVLRIRTERVNGHIRMLVSDTGTGIPAHLHEKIFEPYFTTKEVGKGTGLGLAAVYGTAQEHGGSIEVESDEGAGTTFILRLPPAPKAPQANAKATGPAISPVPSLLVLAIDDEPAVLESLSGMLAGLGHVAFSAHNPSEALELLGKTHVDLVILDLVMPEMSGGDLLERLRELRPEIRVLVTSGYSDEPASRFRGDTRTLFLPKPYRRAELALALTHLTSAAKSARE